MVKDRMDEDLDGDARSRRRFVNAARYVGLETGAMPTARIAYVRIGDRRPDPYHEHELTHIVDPAVVDALR